MVQIPRRPMMLIYQELAGRQIVSRLDEMNRTQWLSREELRTLQQKRLGALLADAYQFVPYYRRLFDQAGCHPQDIAQNPESFTRIPILTKAMVREHFEELLTTDPARRSKLSRLTTGGSTGHPLVYMQDSNFRDHVTADILRHLGWAGWDWGTPHAYIWGARFELSAAQSLRVKGMNWVLNRFVTNAFALSEQSMLAFSDEIRRRHPRILFGYTSSVYRYAEFLKEQKIDDIAFDAIFVSAEVLYPAQRQLIEQVLKGRVFNRYGTRELGGISCECSAHTGLHTSMENNYIEILRDLESGVPAQPGETGHIVVTNLNNHGMPFIRYSIEDMGAWSTECSCPCGRALPMMEIHEGRRIDMFTTRDGRKVSPEFSGQVFGVPGIKQFQMIQKSVDLILVRIVNDGPVQPASLERIERAVHATMGSYVEVKFEFPDQIPVLESGKYRYAMSEVVDR